MSEPKKKPFHKTVLGNAVIILALCVLLYWIFFGALAIFTRHGKEQTVPHLTGLSLDSALTILKKENFEFKIDSTFDKTRRLHEVLDQQPEPGSKVKTGRIIFLTVNKAATPLIEMPNLVSLTLRSAEKVMRKYSLVFGDTVWVYDIAQNTILEQRYNGKVIAPGTKIPLGSVIDITVSQGLSDETVNIPDLIGMKYPKAIAILKEKDLRFSVFVGGKISDSATALVYSQYPESRNEYGEPLRIHKGDHIEVRIDQNPTIEKRTYLTRPKTVDSESVESQPRILPPANNPGGQEGRGTDQQNNQNIPKQRPQRG